MPPPSFTCPRCGAVSFHPPDIEQAFCGACHDWTGDPQRGPVHLARSCAAREERQERDTGRQLDEAAWERITDEARQLLEQLYAHGPAEGAAAGEERPFHGVKEVIKPAQGTDFYVGWSRVVCDVVWLGTRAEALADGCPPQLLDHADRSGSSAMGCDWHDAGLFPQHQAFLPRARIAAYATAVAEERLADANALLVPAEESGVDYFTLRFSVQEEHGSDDSEGAGQ